MYNLKVAVESVYGENSPGDTGRREKGGWGTESEYPVSSLAYDEGRPS